MKITMMRYLERQIIKALGIWILIIMGYFSLILWLHLNIPLISNVLGVKIDLRSNDYSVVMTSVFPNWLISGSIFMVVYVSIKYGLTRYKARI
ncbi:hypothetical protein GCM10019817_10280 [Lactobacillus intestinalis]